MGRKLYPRALIGLVVVGFAPVLLIAARQQETPKSPVQAPGNPKLTADQFNQLVESGKILKEAHSLYVKGQYAEAEKLDRKALAMRLAAVGETHTATANSYSNLGFDLRAQGKHAEAESLFRKSVDVKVKVLGEQHAETAFAYANLASHLRSQAKYVEAEQVDRKALDIRRKVLGEKHPDTAASYNFLAMDLSSLGRHAEAEQLSRNGLDIRLNVLGEKSPETAASYHNLAIDLAAQGKYVEAEQANRKALDIRLKVFGEQHAATAATYGNLAGVLRERGQYAEAETLDRKALDICRKLLGEMHPTTGACYNSLAYGLHAQGDYPAAEKFYRKALTIYVKALGEQHPESARCYVNLASVLRDQGQFAAAETLHRQALGVFLKTLGELHAETAKCYGGLASDLNAQGRYAEAEALNRKALAIALKVNGELHPDTFTRYNNLGMDLFAQGRHAEAEKLFRKALDLCRKVRGEQHTKTLAYCGNVAAALCAQGQFKAAEPFDRKALDISIKVHGEEDRNTGISYNNLAHNLSEQGQHAAAAKLSRKAADIFVKVLGERHPKTAVAYINLAFELQSEGQFEAAAMLARKALDIRLEVLGKQHPDTALSYYNLAGMNLDQGDYAEAERLALLGAESFQAARLNISFTGLGRAQFAAKRSPLLLLSALLARNGKPAQAWKHLEVFLARGLFDDLVARNARKLTSEQAKQEAELQAQLANLDKRFKTAGKINAEQSAGIALERDQLMLRLVEFQAQMEKEHGVAVGQVYDLQRMQKALAADAAFVTWLDTKGSQQAKDPGGEHWGVVVRHEGPPLWVKLKPADPEGNWSSKDDKMPADVLQQLQAYDPNVAWEGVVAKLAKQRLKPLEKYLGDVKHLIVLPSQAMAGIPIEALTDRYQISYAPSATIYAWLQEQRKAFPAKSGTTLALGDPVFSEEQAKIALKEKYQAMTVASRGEELKPLPGTRSEVQAIAKLFTSQGAQVTKLLGIDASAQQLEALASNKELKQFRYVHLATHGLADARGGMNSFLALTSENFALAPYGKLSAEQIMRTWQLDADLVTLSACQTGLGEHQGGEGYVGFAQALFLAGAHSLVLSQWPVDDRATSLLMQRFYQNLLGARAGLKGPLSKLEALAEAKQWLRELPRKEALASLQALELAVAEGDLREAQPFAHPHFWAAFILIGDAGTAKK